MTITDTLPGRLTIPAPDVKGAALHLTLDPVEHRRRTQAGGGPILNPDALDTLLALPVGLPVPLASLTERERKTIRRLPQGTATVADGQVTRHAVRPAVVHLATVRGTCSKTDLGKASSFAPFCARAIITDLRPRHPETLIEADYWGIGVVWEHDGEREVLVEPQPWRLMRHSPAGWRFVEQAYAAALQQEAGRG